MGELLGSMRTTLKHMITGGGRTARAPETSVTEVARLQGSSAVQMIDVREPREFAEGHIPASILIPLGALPRSMDELDRSRPVITICRSGHRSLAAADALIKGGFTASSMTGGMLAWQRAQQPVER